MRQIDSTTFRKRFLIAFSIAMLAIPTIGGSIEIFLGVYSLHEVLRALADYTIFYIIAAYVLGVFGLHRLLLYHTGKLEQALKNKDQQTAERIAKQLSQISLYSLVYVLLYSQGGPFSVNYLISTDSLRPFDGQQQLLSYITTLPSLLITLFPFFFYLYEQLGKYLAPQGVVINAIPIRVKILVLGMVIPLLIDMVLLLYFEDRTGYFSLETILLWFGLFTIAAAGAYLTYRSISLGLKPFQGPLHSTKVEALSKQDIKPFSLDEMGLLAKDWKNLLSEYQQHESELQAERNFSNAIVNNANAMFVVLDMQGRIMEFNKACEESTHFKKAEVFGSYVWDHFIIPEEIDAVKAVFQELAYSSFSSNYTNYWLTKEGERRLIAWSNSTIQDETGKVQNVIAIGIDITDQRKAEEELRTSQDTLAKAQAIAHIGHWDWNIITNDLTWSDETFRIFGLTPQVFKATYPVFLEYVHPDDRQAVTAAVNASVEDPEIPYRIEHRVCRPDGSMKIVQERGEIYRDEQGKPLRMVGTVHDITERKKAEEEIRALNSELEQRVKDRTLELQKAMEEVTSASQAKSQFLSRVSHELRTPMNAILGFAQLLELDEQNLTSEQNESVHEILKAGDHLLGLINELIEISRIETGQVQLTYEPVSFCHLVTDVISLMKPAAEKHNIELINHSFGERDITLNTDRTRLRQVLINLINNAIKYNKPNGSVTVDCHTEEADKSVRIIVKDTGIGIAPEFQDSIFQPFIRVDDYVNTEGSGVGLSVCKQIIEVLGGEIGVESELGKGSTFWFTLPVQEHTKD